MGHVEDLKVRHARAVEIASSLEPDCLYFPISGGLRLKDAKSLRVGTIHSGEPVYISSVELNPLGTEAYGAAKDPFLVPYILKHSRLVHSEFVIEGIKFEKLSRAILEALRPITLCLSLSIGAPISIPFILETSWATLPAFTDRNVEIRLTDSGYEDAVLFTGLEINSEVAAFVESKLPAIRKLLSDKKFQIAVEAYEACLKLSNKKIAIATAWTGIEAIFGINSELRFRTALYTASELANADDPYNTFQETMALYDVRSKVVHGADAKPDKIEKAYGKSLGLLMTLLRVIIERGSLRTTKEIEKSLLSRK